MSFAQLITDSTAVIADQLAEPATLTAVGAPSAVVCRAMVDEPSEDAFPQIPNPGIRERSISLWLFAEPDQSTLADVAAAAADGAVVVQNPGTPQQRTFVVDAKLARDPDRVLVAARETT